MTLIQFIAKIEEILIHNGYEHVNDSQHSYAFTPRYCEYYFRMEGNNGFQLTYHKHSTKKQIIIEVRFDVREILLNKHIVKFENIDSFNFNKFKKIFKQNDTN